MTWREDLLLGDHTTRSRGVKLAVLPLIGFPLVAAGLASPIAFFFESNPRGDRLSHFLGFTLALMFFATGIILVLSWARGRRCEKKRAVDMAEHPDTPWTFDNDWGAASARDEVGSRIAEDLGITFRELFRRMKHGRSFLRFGTFPFFLGEKLDARLPVIGAFAGFRSMEITLRCIRERLETGSRGRKEARCYQVYADTRIIDGARQGPLDTEIPVAFHPPADGLGTALSAEAAIYWEIQIKADVPGTQYGARFLVPVYARPVQS